MAKRMMNDENADYARAEILFLQHHIQMFVAGWTPIALRRSHSQNKLLKMRSILDERSDEIN